jgi:hypothetical protein
VTLLSDRFVRRASIAASICLAAMLATTVVYIGWPRVTSALGIRTVPPPAPPAYAAGQQVDVPAAWYADAPHTLIVFARASCAACEKLQPFLKQIVGRMGGHAVMAHPPGAVTDDQQFGRGLGLADDRIVMTVPGLRVRATPTIVLVTRGGVVIDAWEGAGREDRQAAILETLDATVR